MTAPRKLEAAARAALEDLFGPERTAALLPVLRRRLGARAFDALLVAMGLELERQGGPRKLREVGAWRELLEQADAYVERFGA